MEIMVVPKGGGYTVQDKKDRIIYNIKKKSFGGQRYTLHDVSGYELYSLLPLELGRKPRLRIVLNNQSFLEMQCTSMFLDPSFHCKGDRMTFLLKSLDRREFTMIKNDTAIGTIMTRQLVSGDLIYEMVIDDKEFDDFYPLFAVAFDKSFGEINKG